MPSPRGRRQTNGRRPTDATTGLAMGWLINYSIHVDGIALHQHKQCGYQRPSYTREQVLHRQYTSDCTSWLICAAKGFQCSGYNSPAVVTLRNSHRNVGKGHHECASPHPAWYFSQDNSITVVYFSLSLSLSPFYGHVSSRYQTVSILDFIGTKGDGGGSDNWRCKKTCKAPVKSTLLTNQHPAFYRSDALPVAQPKQCQSTEGKSLPLPRGLYFHQNLFC